MPNVAWHGSPTPNACRPCLAPHSVDVLYVGVTRPVWMMLATTCLGHPLTISCGM